MSYRLEVCENMEMVSRSVGGGAPRENGTPKFLGGVGQKGREFPSSLGYELALLTTKEAAVN